MRRMFQPWIALLMLDPHPWLWWRWYNDEDVDDDDGDDDDDDDDVVGRCWNTWLALGIAWGCVACTSQLLERSFADGHLIIMAMTMRMMIKLTMMAMMTTTMMMMTTRWWIREGKGEEVRGFVKTNKRRWTHWTSSHTNTNTNTNNTS